MTDVQDAISAERERCAKIAEAHKGSAARRRKERGFKMPFDMESKMEILTEERGEDIAADIIAREIRKAP